MHKGCKCGSRKKSKPAKMIKNKVTTKSSSKSRGMYKRNKGSK